MVLLAISALAPTGVTPMLPISRITTRAIRVLTDVLFLPNMIFSPGVHFPPYKMFSTVPYIIETV
jgi:hypothetical protein